MLRVVFDTSVYIAAFITYGTAKQALDLARGRNKKIQLLTSAEIMNELGQKLREKFFWPERRIKETIKAITHIAEIIQPQHSLKVLADEEDNRIVECAVLGNADLIVSRDRHLLTLKKYQNIPIVTAVDLLHSVPANPPPTSASKDTLI